MTGREPQIYRLLMMLRAGGRIVRALDVPAPELRLAEQQGRVSADSDGHAYVYLPPGR